MAITAHYVTPNLVIHDAYIRIQRIWGSKEEGWNAWVTVFANEGDTEHKEVFHVNVPYVENENPFVALYRQVENLHFIKKELPVVATVEEDVVTAVEEKPKKAKKKKEA